MECPVCRSPDVKDTTTLSGERRSFKCLLCGEYDISGTVYDAGRLQRLEKDGRQRVLNSARRFALNGERPIITSYDL